MDVDAQRGRILLEESREAVVVLDEEDVVVAASARARQSLRLREGERMPSSALAHAVVVPYELEGRRERLVYLGAAGDQAAYEELRSGFTAAVSHELRTPLARLLALLETATLPGAEIDELVEKARREVEQITELIDEVMFLSELETGTKVVALGPERVLPVLQAVAADVDEKARRAGMHVRVEGDPEASVTIRPRMLRVVVGNLAENAVRYAGEGATLTLSVEREDASVVLRASDDGVGVDAADLPRLFERFYRADRARRRGGTGLGLAIVKHVVTSAGGSVEAICAGHGLEIRCVFPAA